MSQRKNGSHRRFHSNQSGPQSSASQRNFSRRNTTRSAAAASRPPSAGSNTRYVFTRGSVQPGIPSTKTALRRRQLALGGGVDRDRLAQRAREPLEAGLRDVVRSVSI